MGSKRIKTERITIKPDLVVNQDADSVTIFEFKAIQTEGKYFNAQDPSKIPFYQQVIGETEIPELDNKIIDEVYYVYLTEKKMRGALENFETRFIKGVNACYVDIDQIGQATLKNRNNQPIKLN